MFTFELFAAGKGELLAAGKGEQNYVFAAQKHSHLPQHLNQQFFVKILINIKPLLNNQKTPSHYSHLMQQS